MALSCLTQLQVDDLKIDPSCVDNTGTDFVTSHLGSHILAMVQSLKLLMAASQEQLAAAAGRVPA